MDNLDKKLLDAGRMARASVSAKESPHLTEGEISAYLAREINPLHSEIITEHLMGCSRCSGEVRKTFLSRRGLVIVEADIVGQTLKIVDLGPKDNRENRPILSSEVREGNSISFKAECGFQRLDSTATIQGDQIRLVAETSWPEEICEKGAIRVCQVLPNELWPVAPIASRVEWIFDLQNPNRGEGEYEIQVEPQSSYIWRISLTIIGVDDVEDEK